jgi:hypothetical protein
VSGDAVRIACHTRAEPSSGDGHLPALCAYTIEAPGVPAFLAEAWAAASRKPLIRDLVARRRERIVTVATVILHEGVAGGEVAPGYDVDAAARALLLLGSEVRR